MYITPHVESRFELESNFATNALIQACFYDSINNDPPIFSPITPVQNYVPKIWTYNDKTIDGRVGDIPYGYYAYSTKRPNDWKEKITTLENGGSGVLCYHHGLMTRGVTKRIDFLAQELSLNCYNPENFCSLFDHYGLRRALHWHEIFSALEQGKIITCLVKLSPYLGNPIIDGTGYINIVGCSENCFFVEDPKKGSTTRNILSTLQSICTAWIW